MKSLFAHGRRFAPLVAGLFFLPVGLSAVEQPPPKKTEPPKTHVLFMGADLAIQREKKFYRVEDVTGSEFMIRINKKEFFVPTRQRTTGIKVEPGLKLVDTWVQLDGLESGPGYTPANDPRLKFDRASSAAAGAAATQDLAYGKMIQSELSATFSGGVSGPTDPSAPPPAPQDVFAQQVQDELAAARNQLDPTNQMLTQSQFRVGEQADRLQKELAEGNYDAMEVAFKISSPVELDDPYMVVLFKFLERGAKPGNEGMLIYAKALDPIGPKPRYIRVLEGGLPVGFKFVDCQVHVYNRGQEVATNVSPKRVDLSRDEARMYVLMEHLGTNKGATVPASAVHGSLPRPRRAELSLDQINRTVYVKVSKDGQLLGVYQDEACQLALEDDRYVAALGEIFYNPALYQGKPVEGVARLRLGDI